MAVSDVDICNIALGLIDPKLSISALSDNSREAIHCNRHYGPVRDALLRQHPWNFAQKRASIGKLAEAPAFGFANQYQLPADCLHVRELFSGDDFMIESGLLLTNAEPAQIIYTRTVTDEADFDPLFVDAFATKLAAKIVQPITGSTEKVQSLNTLFINALQDAQLADSAEGQADPVVNDPWLEARGIYGTSTPFERS